MTLRLSHSLFFLALLLTLPAFGQDRVAPNDGPVSPTPDIRVLPATAIEFHDENGSYDWGTIDEGEIVTHVFTFTNTGEEDLIISDAKGSCGCTVPAKPTYPIAPGETASLTVRFNSKNKRGRRNQKVTITANTEPAQTFIYLTGEVNTAGSERTEEKGTEVVEIKKDDAAEKECFVVYPNPSTESMKVRLPDIDRGSRADVAIRSQDGQLMAQRLIPKVAGDLTFDVSHYPAGTYYATVVVKGDKPRSQCFVVR